jgi:hypothetical protein
MIAWLLFTACREKKFVARRLRERRVTGTKKALQGAIYSFESDGVVSWKGEW